MDGYIDDRFPADMVFHEMASQSNPTTSQEVQRPLQIISLYFKWKWKPWLLYRSDIAWKDAKYAQIWEYLRDEFELTQRFASLDFKLKFVEVNQLLFIGFLILFNKICLIWVTIRLLIYLNLLFWLQHNIRFLQEILQNRKSDFLEWLIIALIGAEILLSLYDIVHRSASL